MASLLLFCDIEHKLLLHHQGRTGARLRLHPRFYPGGKLLTSRPVKIHKLIVLIALTALAAIMVSNLLNLSSNSADYFIAHKDEVIKSANEGDPVAQYNLAVMYNKGVGVEQSDAEAFKWYGLAAEQGHAMAQYNLGMVYYFGKSVPQDYVAAYKWVMIAAQYGDNAVANDALNTISKNMTPQQITEAENAADKWQKQHGK